VCYDADGDGFPEGDQRFRQKKAGE
jgi:hypothetical protein